jgi:hypothetical protein
MKKKKFDCVTFKNSLQHKMIEKEKKLGRDKYRRENDKWLHDSDDALAVWWRSLSPCKSQGSKPMAHKRAFA